ncbi:MAG: penicillin-binding transpeptidase domain-containing protein [Bariatricus sp.]|nr:penicillin-binding transpeptidase domain-containing protein [Bariatricus sp.]
MSKRKKRKVPALRQKFTKGMQKKLVILFMAILLAFVILIGRITYINASEGENYTKIVLDQQQYTSRTIPFKRGDIVDSNGTKLATSERVYNVILDAKVLLSNEKKADEYKQATTEALQTYFEIDPQTVLQILEENPDSRYNILKKSVDYDTAKAYEKAVDGNTNIQGIWLEEDYIRNYPYNTLACDVIGFSVDGNVGAAGLEASYNSILNGTDGRSYGYQNAELSTTQTVKEPINGSTIVTTLDTNLQSIVEKHLTAFYDSHTNGATEGPGFKNGAVIVMNPNTGEILAMASMPNYNLNKPRDLTKYYSKEAISAMSSEETVDVLNGLWRNFCVSDTYEPGSTIKPFTVATGLEIGKLTGNETYYCGGYLHVGDHDIKCISYDEGGHGYQTLTQVMENSCNVALMEIAMSEGAEEFSKYQDVFGFGRKTGIDLPGEALGLLYDVENMGITDLATNSFGQNFNVTMVQLVAGFSSLINGGNYYEPHLVKAIQDDNGNVTETIEPILEKRTISQRTSELLKSYMYSVVENGSGKYAKVEGYDIGGKTGTAEKLPRGENKNVVSFIGYAPQENPEIVVYVVIDEPNVPNQARCSNQISQLAADIMKEAFPYLGITKVSAE